MIQIVAGVCATSTLAILGPQSAAADAGSIRSPAAPDTQNSPPLAATGKAVAHDVHRIASEASAQNVLWVVAVAAPLLLAVLAVSRRTHRHAVALSGERVVSAPAGAAASSPARALATGRSRRTAAHANAPTTTAHTGVFRRRAPVRAAQLDADRVEVLFATPDPCAPPGWSTVNGGHSWVRPADVESVTRIRQLATPALVTIGHRPGGGALLLDVGTAGTLQLCGDRRTALRAALSMTVELVTARASVFLIGVDIDGFENTGHADQTDVASAVRLARSAPERTAVPDSRSLSARRRTDDPAMGGGQVVFVVDTAALSRDDRILLDELFGYCQPDAGLAAIVIGDTTRRCGEQIRLESATQARWRQIDLIPSVLDCDPTSGAASPCDHAANGSTAADLSTVGQVVDRGEPPPGPPDLSPAHEDAELISDGDAACAVDVYAPPDHDVMIQVFDSVTVHGRDLTNASEVELLTLLTCLRATRPTLDLLATLLDDPDELSRRRSPSHRTMQARVSRLRAKLGDGGDGAPLLPSASVGRGSMGRYSVSDRVVTDFELLSHRYNASLELGSHDAMVLLRDGLDLLAGPPFRARRGYDWAWPEGVGMRVHGIVIEYATRLIDLAFEIDDVGLVLQTVGRAARVIDDPLTERSFEDLAHQFAAATGDPDLATGVAAAHRCLHGDVAE